MDSSGRRGRSDDRYHWLLDVHWRNSFSFVSCSSNCLFASPRSISPTQAVFAEQSYSLGYNLVDDRMFEFLGDRSQYMPAEVVPPLPPSRTRLLMLRIQQMAVRVAPQSDIKAFSKE